MQTRWSAHTSGDGTSSSAGHALKTPADMLDKDIESGIPIRRTSRFDCFFSLLKVLNTATGFSAVLCMVAHGMALAGGPAFTDAGGKEQLLRLYGMLLAAFLALVETEWPLLLANIRLLENWVARGCAQAFLAIFTLQIATSQGATDFDHSIRLYRNVAAMSLLCCSGAYVLGGICCLHTIREGRMLRSTSAVSQLKQTLLPIPESSKGEL